MVEGGGIACLTQEPMARRVLIATHGHHLQRDPAMQRRVIGEKDRAHPAPPKQALDAVVAQDRAHGGEGDIGVRGDQVCHEYRQRSEIAGARCAMLQHRRDFLP